MKTIKQKLEEVKKASFSLAKISIEKRNKIILDIWKKIFEKKDEIICENKKDLEKLEKGNFLRDRLLLDEKRIKMMNIWCEKLVKIKDPLDKNILKTDEFDNLENSLKIKKQAIALWVVACIYEARPNVTIDIAIMCIKSGNAMILRWWSQASFSNNILIKIIKEVLINNKIDENIIYNFPLEREKLEILYKATTFVDVIIPRWSKNLINNVREKSLVPVIETWAWVVHLYLDNELKQENFEKAINIIINTKTSRPSVCNALDTLIINKNLDKKFVEKVFEELEKKWVNILKIEEKNDYFKEQLSLNLSIKFVENLQQAIEHIRIYSTKHSDWILSDNLENIEKFKNSIDSSAIFINTSTRFSDWECFSFGWEIWISTQKLHARWPMWVNVLTTYKYVVESDWKVRN